MFQASKLVVFAAAATGRQHRAGSWLGRGEGAGGEAGHQGAPAWALLRGCGRVEARDPMMTRTQRCLLRAH